MRYTQLSQGGAYPYPKHDIAPEKKNADWCMQYARAAFYDWSYSYPKGMFANNGGDYDKFRMYALGKQPITPYKRWLGVDPITDNTWLTVDWSVRPIISTYRDKAISRLMRDEDQIVATPIDMLAKSEMEDYYADLLAKLAVRQLIMQTNQEMGSHPLIKLQSGEPMDIEELEMRMNMGEQFNRSKDAELAISLGFYENKYKIIRRWWYEDLFDYGVCGYREWLGKDNKAKFRRVDPQCVVTNYCRKSDFSDLIHAGELIDVPLIELATLTDKEGNKMFTEEQLTEFANSLTGQFGNPKMMGAQNTIIKPYDKFKCKVLDICFYSYNDYVYRNGKDEFGNNDFRKADYNRGKKSEKYIRKNIQVVYKCKWIIGTEYCYDWGLEEDRKTKNNPKEMAYTSLPYKFFAYNFYEMKAQGFMERLIPYLDEYQLTILKIQNFKNRAVPSGWWIDLDAMENVALNKGGKNMTPKELLQMFFETGVLVGRSKDAAGNPHGPNWKPVIPIENTAASELAMFYQDLIAIVQRIEAATGYNDITSGDPNPKTLVPGYETANMSTNDALYPMQFAENYLTECLAADVLCRMQQGVKKGSIEGHAPYENALNKNTLTFIKVSPSIANRDYGIMLQEKTTDEQKIWLLQQMQQDIANGYLDASDAVTLINSHNPKQAQQTWAYKVKKNKEIAQQNELAKIEANNRGASEAAMMAAQLEGQQKQVEYDFELQKEQMKIMAELKKEEMRLQAQLAMKQLEMGVKQQMNSETAQAKIITQDSASQAKVVSQEIASQTQIISDQITSEAAIEKQKLANPKPASPVKK